MHICVIYEYVFFWLFLNFISYALAASRAKRAEPNKNMCCKFFFEGFFWVLQGLRGMRGMRGALCVLRLHVYTLYSHKVAVVAVAVVVGILR